MRIREDVVVLTALFCVACGSSSTPAAATSSSAAPTTDAVTQTYVALVKAYWSGEVAADGNSGNINVASRACLGTISNNAAPDEHLVETATCHERGVLILANQENFLAGLKGTIAPEQFAADDLIFRREVPRAIVALEAMNAAAAAGKQQATFDAANGYVSIMVPSVTGAMDDVDPSTQHG